MNESTNEVYTDAEYKEPILKTPFEQTMEKLEMEYQKGSLIAAILEIRLRIRELNEKLEPKAKQDQESPKTLTR